MTMDLPTLAAELGTVLQTPSEGGSSFFSLEMVLLVLIGGAVILGALWITQSQSGGGGAD